MIRKPWGALGEASKPKTVGLGIVWKEEKQFISSVHTGGWEGGNPQSSWARLQGVIEMQMNRVARVEACQQ